MKTNGIIIFTIFIFIVNFVGGLSFNYVDDDCKMMSSNLCWNRTDCDMKLTEHLCSPPLFFGVMLIIDMITIFILYASLKEVSK